MQPSTTPSNGISRRTFAGTTVATALVGTTLAKAPSGAQNSPIKIGTITYSYRSMPNQTAQDILRYAVEDGLSSVELMGNTAENFALQGKELKGTDLMKWRLNTSMEPYKKLRKLYEQAGIGIHIVKFPRIGSGTMSDAEIDYYFNVAKALGAKAISREMNEQIAVKLGPMADKHKTWIAFHNHTQLTETTYDGPMLSHGDYLGINFDIGHYVAGTNRSPIPFFDKYRDKIISMHIKDRRILEGPNQPFGQGDTPVALLMQHLKRLQAPAHVDIELEYRIPKGSNAVVEVKRCRDFLAKSLS